MDELERYTVEIILEPLCDENSTYTTATLEQAIIENQNDFELLFARLIDMGDSRMEVVDDSLVVGEITFDGDSYIADVMFDSSHYMGCKDMDSGNDHEATLEFTINNGVMCFDIVLPPAWIPE